MPSSSRIICFVICSSAVKSNRENMSELHSTHGWGLVFSLYPSLCMLSAISHSHEYQLNASWGHRLHILVTCWQLFLLVDP
jgi:hypothetical protein